MADNYLDKRIQGVSKKIQTKVAQIDQLKEQWKTEANKLSPEFLAELKKKTLIASTGSSTRLAGSRLSDWEVEKIIQSKDL